MGRLAAGTRPQAADVGFRRWAIVAALAAAAAGAAAADVRDSVNSSSKSRRIIRPDGRWLDTDGQRIQAHGGGVVHSPLDNRWYWYGETRKTSNNSEHGINCYSAESLAGPWRFHGNVLPQEEIVVPGIEGPYVVERPKVLYNELIGNFIMWFHLDNGNYTLRYAGVARSLEAAGPFEFVSGFRPDGEKSLDMSLFMDPVDRQAYFIRSVDNLYVGISRLSPDYLNTTGIISNHSRFEGMAIFRHPNGTYFVLGSHLTGWSPNPLMLFRAEGKTLDDPQWVDLGNPTGCPTSFNSQPASIVSYTPAGGGEPYFVYMADDWILCPKDNSGPSMFPIPDLEAACYVWLPIHFDSGGAASIEWRPVWDMDDPFATKPECHHSCSACTYWWLKALNYYGLQVVMTWCVAAVVVIVLACIGVACLCRLWRDHEDPREGGFEALSSGEDEDSSEEDSTMNREDETLKPKR